MKIANRSIYLFTLLVFGLSACTSSRTEKTAATNSMIPPEVTNPTDTTLLPGIVRSTAVYQLGATQVPAGAASLNVPEPDMTLISVQNAESVNFAMDKLGETANPGSTHNFASSNSILTFGDVKVSQLFDNNLMCGTQKCEKAQIRMYVKGLYPGLYNPISNQSIPLMVSSQAPGAPAPLQAVGLEFLNAVLVHEISIPADKWTLSAADFKDLLNQDVLYSLGADFSNASNGVFTAEIVFQYVLIGGNGEHLGPMVLSTNDDLEYVEHSQAVATVSSSNQPTQSDEILAKVGKEDSVFSNAVASLQYSPKSASVSIVPNNNITNGSDILSILVSDATGSMSSHPYSMSSDTISSLSSMAGVFDSSSQATLSFSRSSIETGAVAVVSGSYRSSTLLTKKYTLKQVSDIYSGNHDNAKFAVSAASEKGVVCVAAGTSGQATGHWYEIDASGSFQDLGLPCKFWAANGHSDSHGKYYLSGYNSTEGGIFLYSYDGSTIKRRSDLPGGDFPINIGMYSGAPVMTIANETWNYRTFRLIGENFFQLGRINLGVTGGDPAGDEDGDLYTEFKGDLYWVAKDEFDTRHLYKYDGSQIKQVSDHLNGADEGIWEMVAWNNALYMNADAADAPGNQKLYRYDGTNFEQISDMNAGGDDGINALVPYRGKLYFFALDINGNAKLHSYDGSSIVQVSNINPGGWDVTNFLRVYGDNLYFVAYGADQVSTKLMKYDGVKITQMSDIRPEDDDSVRLFGGVSFSRTAIIKNALFFQAFDANGKLKIFRLCDVSQACTP